MVPSDPIREEMSERREVFGYNLCAFGGVID
jgi:hypothetical protein